MNRTEELRQEVTRVLNNAILDFEQIGNPELDGDYITLDYVTAKRLYNMLTEPATWIFYRNDENEARWKCSSCGKIVRKNPHDKRFCSNCSKPMVMES